MPNTIEGSLPWVFRPLFYSPKNNVAATKENIALQYKTLQPQPGWVKRSSPAVLGSLGAIVLSAIGYLYSASKDSTFGRVIGGALTLIGILTVGIAQTVFNVNLEKKEKTTTKETRTLTENEDFKTASPMLYANKFEIKQKYDALTHKVKDHIKTIDKDPSLFYEKGETVYIPDTHGDFVHLITTLHRHDLLDENLNLNPEHPYVFLGDFYDRGEDSDVVDHWLNIQIQNGIKIHRLAGNHELMFMFRDKDGNPLWEPTNDAKKDIKYNYEITENILKHIAEGTILAAYVDPKKTPEGYSVTYSHSFFVNDDFIKLGLQPNSDIKVFVKRLNERFQNWGKLAHPRFLEQRTKGRISWRQVQKEFNEDPATTFRRKVDHKRSFIWRRTKVSKTDKEKHMPQVENIPDNVIQIVGHTPIDNFDIPNLDPTKPLLIQSQNGNGKILFGDVGMSYEYDKDSLERSNVTINKKLATEYL